MYLLLLLLLPVIHNHNKSIIIIQLTLGIGETGGYQFVIYVYSGVGCCATKIF